MEAFALDDLAIFIAYALVIAAPLAFAGFIHWLFTRHDQRRGSR